jgi:hypothetical protein
MGKVSLDDGSEFILEVIKSPDDNRDFLYSSVCPATAEDPLPDVFDLRPELTEVRNQGGQGSCVGQSCATIKEWQERQDVNFTKHMSPQFIYDSRINLSGSGMHPRDAMSILRKQGCPPESDYPYRRWAKDRHTKSEIKPEVYTSAERYKIKHYARIQTLDDLRRALVVSGPCLIAVPVYNQGPEMWKSGPGSRYGGGHAMAIVGYDDIEEHFIIRNSWGKSWGDRGYCYFKYEDWGCQWEVWSAVDELTGEPNEDDSEDLTIDPSMDLTNCLPDVCTDYNLAYSHYERNWYKYLAACAASAAAMLGYLFL